MRTTILFIFIFVSVANAQKVAPLDSTDFLVAKIKDDLDSNSVKRILGKPSLISTSDNPFDEGAKLVSWHYPGLIVNLGSENSTCGVTITSQKYLTKRGLRVGDSISKVMMLYGKPDSQYDDRLNYLVTEEELHAIQVRIKNGKVYQIFLGWFLD